MRYLLRSFLGFMAISFGMTTARGVLADNHYVGVFQNNPESANPPYNPLDGLRVWGCGFLPDNETTQVYLFVSTDNGSTWSSVQSPQQSYSVVFPYFCDGFTSFVFNPGCNYNGQPINLVTGYICDSSGCYGLQSSYAVSC